MSSSIKKNLMYNILLQVVTLLIPLVTVPYVSRVLGKDGVGTYSYTLSIVQYFIIIGTLGISMYGNRAIAYVRDDKEKMSKTFWSITALKALTSSIALLVYILIFGINKKYGTIFLIQSINIIANIIDISWLYMGLEDFKKTVTRNLVVKIICVISIFLFIKDYDDLYLYVIINAMMVLVGNLVMWAYVPKIVSKVKIKFVDIKEHFIPAFQLFIPQIAIQIYAVLDKTMLGSMTTVGEVGLYEQSQKIVKLVLSLVTSLGVVMLPRMSNTFANGDIKKMDEYLNRSLRGVAYVSIPMTIGLASISNEFVPWFFGEEFSAVSYLMIILSPILFLIAMSNVLGTQYLLPSNRTKEFTASVTCGAIINVLLNLVLIPKYKAIGSCISTVVAEFTVTAIQYFCLKKNINKKEFFKGVIKYIVAGSIMFIIVRIVGSIMGIGMITTMIQGIIGVIIYISVLILFKEDMNMVAINIIKGKIKR